MRTVAVLAAIVVGWFVTAIVLSIAESISGIVIGSAGALIPVAGAIGLAVLVARLVPRSTRSLARQQQRMERIVAHYRRG